MNGIVLYYTYMTSFVFSFSICSISTFLHPFLSMTWCLTLVFSLFLLYDYITCIRYDCFVQYCLFTLQQ